MTKQEIFDEFYLNFVTNKRKRNTPRRAGLPLKENCYGVYKYPGCAIGCLTAFQEIYDPDMEGLSIYGVLGEFPQVRDLFQGIPEQFLEGLQYIHDSPLCWTIKGTLRISSFRRFMSIWNLELPRS